jgi:DNA-directed RNA polymerase specialized sigma24 family protein
LLFDADAARDVAQDTWIKALGARRASAPRCAPGWAALRATAPRT